MTTGGERLLLFGASGAIGGAILGAAGARGWQVTAVSRHGTAGADAREGVRWIAADPLEAGFSADALAPTGPYTSVCWAQGANRNDSVYDVSVESHLAIYNANCTYILVTLQALDPIFIDFTLPQQNLDRVKVGQKVKLEIRKVSEEGAAGVINYGYKAVPV